MIDNRSLSLPEPFDKHAPQFSRNRRHEDEWSWEAWRSWQLSIAGREWRKPAIRKVFMLRESDPANANVNFKETKKLWDTNGVIYGVFHFASGRWYVGQTVNKYGERAQKHWYERRSASDLFHTALDEFTPFFFAIFPLEVIEERRNKCQTREATVTKFRFVATPKRTIG